MNKSSTTIVPLLRMIFVGVVSAFLFIPITNDLLSIYAERAPYGMPMPNAAPPLSRHSFLSRSWQRRLEPRAKRNSGLWYPMTLFANEIYTRVFGQVSTFNSGSVKLGKNSYFFQTAHLRTLNHHPPKNSKLLPERVANIKELQDRLKARGKTLLIVVTPNMATLYPELIPQGFIEPARMTRPHPYEAVDKAFKEANVAYVDTVALLRSVMQTFPFRLFAPTGSHWNDVASCLALRGINMKLREIGRHSFRDFSCDDYALEDTPRRKDRDLLDIANVMFPERYSRPTPYVRVRYLEPEPKSQPSVLLVGTSYLFAISEHLHDWNLAPQHKLFFYFRSWRSAGQESFRPLVRQNIDWDEVFSNDIIIVNVGVENPVTVGYGFIEAALTAIRKQDELQGSKAQMRAGKTSAPHRSS